MDRPEGWFRLPAEFRDTGDPIGGNPFAAEDSRHRVWSEATAIAEAEAARINAQWMAELSLDNVFAWKQTLVAAKFDVWVRRGVSVLHHESEAGAFDNWLVDYANSCMDSVHADHVKRPPPYPADLILLELRNMLGQRVQVWKAEARSVIAERSASRSAARVENSPGRERLQITARTIAKRKALVKDYRDRRELSATALARAASMSDTTIRGIVNEDWKRFSASSQRSLLDLLRLTEAEWYQE